MNKTKAKAKKYFINTTIYIQCIPFSTLYTTKKANQTFFNYIYKYLIT